MRMKTKKLVSAALCVCMLMGMLTACGQKETGEESGQSSSVAKEETKGSAEASKEAQTDDLSEKVTLKLTASVPATNGDWNEFYCIKQIEEKFNVDIQIEMISSDAWTEKFPLMFASNDLPDFFINVSDADIVTYSSQGYFTALEDYITEEATPNLWNLMEKYPDVKKASTELDGHIYAVRGINTDLREQARNRFYVRTEWANEILGKMPETVDEFYEYLKGVKENDMDGDGDPNNEIPLGGRYNVAEMRNVMFSLVQSFGHTSLEVEALEDGSVIYVPAQDSYKEFLKYLNLLYEEELLDNEFFTQTEEQYIAKDTQNIYGAHSNYTNFGNGRSTEELFTLYSCIEPMTSSVNDTKIWSAYPFLFSSNLVITKECENLDRMLMVMDYIFSEEGQLLINNGWPQGENPEWPEYGYIAEWSEDGGDLYIDFYGPDGAGDIPDGYEDYNDFRFNEIGPNYGLFPTVKDFNAVWTEGSGQAWLTQTLVDNVSDYYVCGWPAKVKYTSEENDELNLLKTDINAYKSEMETKMIIGELDIEETWPTYIEGLKARGLEDMVAIWQLAYERYNAN